MTDYLIAYGLGGFIGRYASEADLNRDDRVVIRSPRGLEVGTVLGRAENAGVPPQEGTVVRPATSQDADAETHARGRAAELLATAQREAERQGLPLLFLDGEVLLDGSAAILQAIHWSACDATPLFERLSAELCIPVRLADMTAAPKAGGCSACGKESSGCDSCGTGGGCSTGSCSRGAVQSAEDLAVYFANLRRQMEAGRDRVPLA